MHHTNAVEYANVKCKVQSILYEVYCCRCFESNTIKCTNVLIEACKLVYMSSY